MKAIVVRGPGQWAMEDAPLPEIPAGWARIRVSRVAFCTTDLEVLYGKIKARYPIIPGHEWCGVVTEVNGGDESWIGKRVAGSNDVCCLVCDACRRGLWRNCAHFGEIGFAHNGGFAEYMVVPQYALKELPDGVTDVQAALLEPLGVALGTLEKVQAALGDSLLILGAGSIGLNMLAAAHAAGMTPIAVADLRPSRLQMASQMGASAVIPCGKEIDFCGEIHRLFPEGPDVIVDCTGVESCIRLALETAPRLGRVALAGYGRGADMRLHYDDIHVKDLRVAGTGNNWNTLPKALRLVANGIVNTTCMATHFCRLEDYDAVVDMARTSPDGFIKAVFAP